MNGGQSVGEFRVRTSFNVGGDSTVDQIKKKTAELIDLVNGIQPLAQTEQARLVAIAMTTYEEAAMWAVKAATA